MEENGSRSVKLSTNQTVVEKQQFNAAVFKHEFAVLVAKCAINENELEIQKQQRDLANNLSVLSPSEVIQSKIEENLNRETKEQVATKRLSVKEKHNKLLNEIQQMTPMPKYKDILQELRQTWHCSKEIKTSTEGLKRDIIYECNIEPLESRPNRIMYNICISGSNRPEDKELHRELKSLSPQYEMVVSSDTKLASFLDAVYCLRRLTYPELKSRFMVMGNVVYDDTPTNEINISTTFLESQLLSGNTKMKRISLGNKTFDDCMFEMNQQYKLVHLGNCVHYFWFSNASLTNNSKQGVIPKYTKVPELPLVICHACNLSVASIRCVNDPVGDTDPSFYCQPCYISLHYDEEGNLCVSSDFRMYPYKHSEVVTYQTSKKVLHRR